MLLVRDLIKVKDHSLFQFCCLYSDVAVIHKADEWVQGFG